MGYMIGVDVGGTFTDFSVFHVESKELFHFKNSSTPDDPSRAIVNGINQILEMKGIKPPEIVYLAHGTTVATNALIEKKGARLGLITTKGFRDLMEIGNQKRPSLYDLLKDKPESLIPSGLKCEVEERIMYDGKIKIPLKEQDVLDAVEYLRKQGVATIAVCTLFSFINPVHEKRIKEIIHKVYPQAYVSVSSELVSEFREYSRMSTTVLNAYLGPVMKNYVNNFEKCVREAGIKVSPYVTQSNGSIISISETIECPIKTAVSGPSAGVIGASYIGQQCGVDKIITFDMGGTSIDVSLIEGGKAQISYERMVEGYPARIPMIDIITVGAGGGSIAAIDEGGALKAGPKSAGAVPGPACYKRGGMQATVTDANIILGKLNQKNILGGRMEVDIALAKEVIQKNICNKSSLSLEDAAAGIISVVNSNMVRAVRNVSVERGFDARDFTLMAFGGAGPLHACEVARELGITKVLLPPSPGTLCSLGLLMADTRFDFSRSNIMLAEELNIGKIKSIFDELREEGNRMLANEGMAEKDRSFIYTVDCRYERQNYEISVEVEGREFNEASMEHMIAVFHAEHNKSYGYCDFDKKIQMVNYRVGAIGTITKPDLRKYEPEENRSLTETIEVRAVRFEGEPEYRETKVYAREEIPIGAMVYGPAIIEQMDSTSVIPPGWNAYHDEYANLIVIMQNA